MNNPYEVKQDSGKPMENAYMNDPFMPQDIRQQKAANKPIQVAVEGAMMPANNPYANNMNNMGVPPPNPIPPPPPVYVVHTQQPQMIIVNNRQVGVGPCPHCKSPAGVIDQKKPGIATWSWCVVGCLLGGVCCFWIPFVIDDCYDHQIRCSNCRVIRQVVRSDFCCCD